MRARGARSAKLALPEAANLPELAGAAGAAGAGGGWGCVEEARAAVVRVGEPRESSSH